MTTPAHLTPEYPADADGHRDGFKWMPALGGDAFMGTSGKVRLVESSLADGPHIEVWSGHRDDDRRAGALTPLSAADAWRLKEQIEWLLEHHYQGDARPPSERLRPSPDATTADLIVALSDEVTRLTRRAFQVEYAAKRLLEHTTPIGSSLELEDSVVNDAGELYGDLAEALESHVDDRTEGA